MGKTELKPCPFCGGIGEIKSGKAYYIDCVYAHCTECGVSTPKVPINHLFYTKGKNVRLSEEQAKERATNDWNRRAKNKHSGWISIKDRLPDKHTRVLCYFKYEPESPDVISENTYHSGGLWLSEGSKVTHWMPLPKPPKKGGAE